MEVKADRKDVSIILTHHEAEWLKTAMQNPFCSNEDPENTAMRKNFWYALNENLPKGHS